MGVTSLKDNYSAAPDVAAQGGGGDTSNVRATPESFGAGVGAAVEKAGNTGFDTVEHFQQMANEAHANDVIANQFAPAAAQLSQDFYSKQGKDAVLAEPAYVQSLTALRSHFLTDQNPAVQQMLGTYMTRHAAQETDGAARHAEQQQIKYEDDSHKAFLQTLSDDAVSNFNNPDLVKAKFDQMDGQIRKHGMDRGQSDEAITEDQRSVRGATVNSMVGRALAAGDVPTANQIYSQNKEYIPGHQQLDIDKMLHGENMKYNAQANVQALNAGKPMPHTGVGHSVPEVQATVASAAQKAGLDPNDALATASIESNFGQNVGKRGDIGQTGKGGDTETQVANMVAEKKKSNDIATDTLGRTAEPWEGYVCYQQGAGGGPALLKAATADPTARAVDVLRPLYSSNKEALSAIQGNGGNASMTSGQFLDFIKQNYQAHAARAECAMPRMAATFGDIAATPSDTGLNPDKGMTPVPANLPSLSEAILAPTKEEGVATQQGATPVQSLMEYDKTFPDKIMKASQIPNIDLKNETLETLRRERDVYTQAASAYKSNLINQVAQISNDPKFTDVDDPRLTPEMKTAIKTDAPHLMTVLEASADRNSKMANGLAPFANNLGEAAAFRDIHNGSLTSVESLAQRVWKPGDDPKDTTKISIPSYKTLSEEMTNKAQNPKAAADDKLKSIVFENIHNEVSPKYMRELSPENEEKWGDAYIALNNALDKNREANVPDRESLDRNSKNYIGLAVAPMLANTKTGEAIGNTLKPKIVPTAADKVLADPYVEKGLRADFDAGKYKTNRQAGLTAIVDAVNKRKISVAVGNDMAVKYGYVPGE